MLDSRGFELNVGAEVLVVTHKNQVELAGTIITCRKHYPFKTIILGTVVGYEIEEGTGFAHAGDQMTCTIKAGSIELTVKGDTENGWHNQIFTLPRHGE